MNTSQFFLVVSIFISSQFAALALALPLPAQLMTPSEALKLANSEPLKYIGKYIPSDSVSGKIPSCVFRNSKITLIYHYCTKSEAPALSLTIHNRDNSKGHVKFYAEGDGRPVSQIHRNEYEQYFWKVYANPNSPGYSHDFSAEKYSSYYTSMLAARMFGCYVTEYVGQPGVAVSCTANYKDQQKKWEPQSLVFWKQPPKSWYKLQLQLRAQIKNIF